MGWGYNDWGSYVSVATRKANALRYASKLAKNEGRELHPVKIKGKKIAHTFWGQAWCENLERYSRIANRLPRGKTYARNGSVIDLMINAGRIDAIVAGTEVYTVEIEIDKLKPAVWSKIKSDCSKSIDSVMDLLAGRFSDGVMKRLTRKKDGLFPKQQEIRMACDCPDFATVCKHISAAFYGVAAQLDDHPELLFVLRDVDQHELITEAVSEENLDNALGTPSDNLAGEDLGAMFGIDLESISGPADDSSLSDIKTVDKPKSRARKKSVKSKKKSSKRTAAKKVVKKKKPTDVKPERKSVKKKAKKVAKKRPAKKKAAKKRAVNKKD
jgi:uncharacterized Zn finger protein